MQRTTAQSQQEKSQNILKTILEKKTSTFNVARLYLLSTSVLIQRMKILVAKLPGGEMTGNH